jgi:DNA replication protein DnaC
MQMIEYSYEAEVAARRKALQNDEATTEHLQKFYSWITSQNTKSWLVLNGNRGTGKSTLILAFADVVKQLYPKTYKSQGKALRIVNARDILSIATYQPQDFEMICNCELLAINDIGTEAPGKVWGTTSSPLADILYSRYDKMLLTVFTTNLSSDDIGRFYGPRLQDRFTEMCDYIGFNNKSYR